MKMNLFDRIIESVSPGAALRRMRARLQMDAVRKYDAAAKSRGNSDWFTPATNANQEIMSALTTLRNRSRDLARNNYHMIQAIRTIRNNVVGMGIIPTPVKKDGTGKNQLKKLKQTFEEWASSTSCDFDDAGNFYAIQGLVVRALVESGEVLIRRVTPTGKDAFPLKLQVLEADFIDHSHHNGAWQTDGTMEFFGIKISKSGQRLGYWIYKSHPYEYGIESEFVNAEDIIHVYERERPGQMRGVPFGTAVLPALKDLADFQFTELTRAKIAASFAVFITDGSSADGAVKKDKFTRVSPGMIGYLEPGQQVQTAQPPRVEGGGSFVRDTLRGVSAGVGVSYEALTNDYSQVNFSSGRMGRMEFQQQVEHLQYNLIIPNFCDRVFAWFLQAAQLRGIVPFTAKIGVTWTAPKKQMIDPYKEIMAIKEQLRAGLTSWTDVVKSFGYVPEQLIEELRSDKQFWDEIELKPTIDPRFDPNRTDEKDPADPGDGDLNDEEKKKEDEAG